MIQPSQTTRTSTSSDALLPLHAKEAALIRYLRAMGFGVVYRLIVRDGLPELAEEVHPTIRFE